MLVMATAILARAGGGQNFGGGGGGGGGLGGGGVGGGGGGRGFFFFGGGGGLGGGVLSIVVIIVVLLVGAVFVVQYTRRGGMPLEPPAPYPHSDQPAMPGGWAPGGRSGVGGVGDTGGAAMAGGGAGGGAAASGLAAIKGHDPAFTETGFLSDVERAFFTVEEAWTERKPDMSRQVMADGIWQQHRSQVEGYINNGTRNVLDGLAVGRATIINASSDQTYDTITVRLLAACTDYDIEVSSGKVIRGNKHEMTNWQEDWTFTRSSEATTRTDGGTMQKKCPNCGAPLDLDLAGVCSYCKAPVMSGKYDWVLSRIDQVA